MKRNQQNELAKSASRKQGEPTQRDEAFEGNKSEVEKKAERIMELLNSGGEGRNKKRGGGNDLEKGPELAGLVEDFIKQYQSLHVLYDQLKQDASASTPSRNEIQKIRKFDSATSFFSSDSEYFSPEELDPENLGGSDTPTATPDIVFILKNELNSVKKEKEALSSQLADALTTARELENVIANLKAEVTGLNSEAESLRRHKCELQASVQDHETKIKVVNERNTELQARIRKLENTLGSKDNKIAKYQKKLDDNKIKMAAEAETKSKQWASEIAELVSCVREKDGMIDESSNRIKDLEEELRRKFEDEDSRKNLENNEAEMNLKRREGEIAELVSRIQEKDGLIDESSNRIRGLDEELGRKIEERKRAIIEIDRLSARVKDAELKNDEAVHQRENEASLFRREKAELEAKILETERKSREMGDEIFERSLHATEITARAESLQKQVDSLLVINGQLESQKRKSDEESCQLTITIGDLRSKLNDQGGIVVKLSSKYTQAKNSLQQAKSEFRAVERRMEGMTEEFRKNIDDSIRLLHQRIRVIEQLHGETKDCYRAMKDGFRRDNKGLEEVTAKHETELRRLRDVALLANKESWRLDTAVRGIDDALRKIAGRVARISGEVQGMMMNRAAARAMVAPMTWDEDEEKEMLTSWYLRVANEKGSCRQLMRVVWRLEKKVVHLEGLAREREEVLLRLAAEKREAIKQLCVLIDYHRGRSDHYRDVISRMAICRMVGS